MTRKPSRRDLLRLTGAGLAAPFGLSSRPQPNPDPPLGDRPPPPPPSLQILNPLDRVPVSLIVDDSTALVNLAHFAIPQFAEVFPSQYRQPWRQLPREIPDRFVARFAAWCAEHHVRGKYSMVPYPACVGWLDRDLPGWSKAQLEASLELVRRELLPAWDIHPEMVSHTWAIDTRTGRPLADRSQDAMENWGFSQNKSADELTDYLAYALSILRNVGLPCAGITTPGGFGSRNLANLSQAVAESVRDIFSAPIPHYFRHVYEDDRSVAPRVERASGLDGDDPRCVVSIIGCTGDWFGGWDGLEPGSADRFLSADGRSGRLADVIARGEPAVMVGHWPGFYANGTEHGFRVFQDVVARLETHAADRLIWMNLSELARYWAARELTRIEADADPATHRTQAVRFIAPFPCPGFTLRIHQPAGSVLRLATATALRPLASVENRRCLQPGTTCQDGNALLVCFDLPRGSSTLQVGR
ncbi:MAG: hypothetical protein KatS3mg108_0888 [Isosphaeraceae bacterium]|nr:MAG: hypothetical protein KatS3mg108_0888 [Isosphaeraceae bacterium]